MKTLEVMCAILVLVVMFLVWKVNSLTVNKDASFKSQYETQQNYYNGIIDSIQKEKNYALDSISSLNHSLDSAIEQTHVKTKTNDTYYDKKIHDAHSFHLDTLIELRAGERRLFRRTHGL